MASFEFTRLTSGGRNVSSALATAFDSPDGVDGQNWLFVAPHDDDLCLGAGLLMQAARMAGVNVHVLIVTDGCLGYCDLADRDSIIEIRQRETYESFEVLGIPRSQVVYIGYPDGGLTPYIGRRQAQPGEKAIEGYTGLQNAFTHHLRRVRPERVFTPTHTDLHPDHRITHSELMISIFHAAGAIWPELGETLPQPPAVGELAVYCDFAGPPDLQIKSDQQAFETKLTSVEAYRSQAQIAALVAATRKAGPYEYVRNIEFQLYSPDNYRALFAEG